MKQINNVKIEVPKNIPSINPKDIRGYDMFPEKYLNLFICAKKKSGKSVTLINIIKQRANKDTIIFVFSPTAANKDKTWISALNNELKGYNITIFDSILDKLDAIKEILMPAKVEEEKENIDYVRQLMFDLFEKKGKVKEKEYMIILDDLGDEAGDKRLAELLKKNRHCNCTYIISSQYFNDVHPQGRKQLDYWILFGGHRDDKLELIHRDSDVHLDYESFRELYKDATKNKYDFLYIDSANQKFRKNFTHEYEIGE